MQCVVVSRRWGRGVGGEGGVQSELVDGMRLEEDSCTVRVATTSRDIGQKYVASKGPVPPCMHVNAWTNTLDS